MNKDSLIKVLISEEDKVLVERICQLEGLPASAYFRRLVRLDIEARKAGA